jgi:hypothetical protein
LIAQLQAENQELHVQLAQVMVEHHRQVRETHPDPALDANAEHYQQLYAQVEAEIRDIRNVNRQLLDRNSALEEQVCTWCVLS